jgi:hypothetical protein
MSLPDEQNKPPILVFTTLVARPGSLSSTLWTPPSCRTEDGLACLTIRFLALEHDNQQGGPNAAIKRLYSIHLGDFAVANAGTAIEKVSVRDLMPDLLASGSLILKRLKAWLLMKSLMFGSTLTMMVWMTTVVTSCS